MLFTFSVVQITGKETVEAAHIWNRFVSHMAHEKTGHAYLSDGPCCWAHSYMLRLFDLAMMNSNPCQSSLHAFNKKYANVLSVQSSATGIKTEHKYAKC